MSPEVLAALLGGPEEPEAVLCPKDESRLQLCSFSAWPSQWPRGGFRIGVVGRRPEGMPQRPFSKSRAVLGCAPARLNWPVSLGKRHAAGSSRSSRSRSAISASSSQSTRSAPPPCTSSSRSGRTNCTAPAQSSPTLAIRAKGSWAETWNLLAHRSKPGRR